MSDQQLPSSFTNASITAILDERKATGPDAAAGSQELQVAWEGEGGAPQKIWLPRALLMADGVTEGMVQEFEDNLVRRPLPGPDRRLASSIDRCCATLPEEANGAPLRVSARPQLERSAKGVEEAASQFDSFLTTAEVERAARTGSEPAVRLRDLAHALETMGLSYGRRPSHSLPAARLLPPPYART
jgi:hypothetical protein